MESSTNGHAYRVEVISESRRGDGHHKLLKVAGGNAVQAVKQYGRKRSQFRVLLRSIGNLTYAGKSSILIAERMRTEAATLELWTREGIDVPRLIPREDALNGVRDPALILEWISGPSLLERFEDPELPLESKLDLMRRFTAIWCHRHDRAIALNEPRLIYEHPTFAHVLLSGDRFVHIDFEIVFTSQRRLERQRQREILGFIRSLAKVEPAEHIDPLIRAFAESYESRDRLQRLVREAQNRILLRIDGLKRSRGKTGMTKRATLARIQSHIDAAPVAVPEPARS